MLNKIFLFVNNILRDLEKHYFLSNHLYPPQAKTISKLFALIMLF